MGKPVLEFYAIFYQDHLWPICLFSTRGRAQAYFNEEMGEDGTGAYAIRSVFLPELTNSQT